MQISLNLTVQPYCRNVSVWYSLNKAERISSKGCPNFCHQQQLFKLHSPVFYVLCSFSVLTRIPFKKQLYLSNLNTCRAIEYMWDKTGFPFERPGLVWHAFLEAIFRNLAKYCRAETLRLFYLSLSLSRRVKSYPLFSVNNLPLPLFFFDEAALVLTNQIKLSHSRCNFGRLIQNIKKFQFIYSHSALIMFWGVGRNLSMTFNFIENC